MVEEESIEPTPLPETPAGTSPEIAKIADALCRAQSAFGAVKKDSEADTGSYVYSYATLANVCEAIREPLSGNGLSYVQLPAYHPRGIALTTRLMHSSGQWIESTLVMPLEKKTAQGIGSCLTYARRYGLMAMLGIPAEDDDGNEASKPGARSKSKIRSDKSMPPTGAQVAEFKRLTEGQDPDDVAMGLQQHGVDTFADLDKKLAAGILKTLRKRAKQADPGTVDKLSDEEAAKGKTWAEGGEDLASELDQQDDQKDANARQVIEAEAPPAAPEDRNALWHNPTKDRFYEYYDEAWIPYDGPVPESAK